MADAAKRGRGRPRTPEPDKPLTVKTTLTPAEHAAWKADGRPLNALVRSALGLI